MNTIDQMEKIYKTGNRLKMVLPILKLDCYRGISKHHSYYKINKISKIFSSYCGEKPQYSSRFCGK